MRRPKEEYDWLNDPFDDKKAAEELERARGPKMAGCLFVVVAMAAIVFIGIAVVMFVALGADLNM